MSIRFAPQMKAMQLAAGKQRERSGQLCPSEVMTILIHFHQSHYRTFKSYYMEHIQLKMFIGLIGLYRRKTCLEIREI
jgi:hypothetical protein